MANKKILVIDDESDITALIKARLELASFDVITSLDGRDGLLKARDENPDLIILDIMLPKLDGFQLCRMLKFDQKYKHIPIIMLTARTSEDDKNTGIEAGADAYIVKPFDAQMLIDKVKELIK